MILSGKETYQNKPTKAKWSWCVEDRKAFVLPPCTVSPGEAQPQFGVCHEGRWADVGWLMEIVWPGVALPFIWRKHCVLVWESVLQSLQVPRKRWGFHWWHQSMKRRSVSSSWVISGQCYDLVRFGDLRWCPLANSLITWKFCWKSDHFRKMLTRKT